MSVRLSGFDYETSLNAKIKAIKQFLHVWAHAIDRLVRSDEQRRAAVDARNWTLIPAGRSCNSSLHRRWAAGEQIVRYRTSYILAGTVSGNSVIQLPSAPIEAGRIINIRHSIYSGTDRVRLNFFF